VWITFDDGWADNEEYALAALKKRSLPAVLFVIAEGIGKTQLWRDTLFRAWRRGRLGNRECLRLWQSASQSSPPPCWTKQTLWALINHLAGLDAERREGLLQPFLAHSERAEPLSHWQLRRLSSSGIHIGSHTLTHTPLTFSPKPDEELRASRRLLAELLSPPGAPGPIAFSFPHGLYDSSSVSAARAAGYRLIFTSDAMLNSVKNCSRGGGVFGRIHIEPGPIQDHHGRLRPELLALWLFPRPHRASSYL
jgi:peptidoglycan/xylan/chitin deacetylase (PgdA/CDA1 family)